MTAFDVFPRLCKTAILRPCLCRLLLVAPMMTTERWFCFCVCARPATLFCVNHNSEERASENEQRLFDLDGWYEPNSSAIFSSIE